MCCIPIIALIILLALLSGEFRYIKNNHDHTGAMIAQMDSSLALVNKTLSDYIKPIEIIERHRWEIHYRDSLIRDFVKQIKRRP